MEELMWIVTVTSVVNMACFSIGAYTMLISIRSETAKTKTINPIKIFKEQKEIKKVQKEIDKEAEKEKIINDNIDNYNGTSFGQKDIPR